MKTRLAVYILIVSIAAEVTAQIQPFGPESLGIFYAAMVLAIALPVKFAKGTAYSAMYFFMATCYLVDEFTDWQSIEMVMMANGLTGLVVWIMCRTDGNANRYIASILLAKCALGFSQFFVFELPMEIFARLHNFLSIAAWISLANLANNNKEYVDSKNTKETKLFGLKLRAFDIWVQQHSTSRKK